MLKRIFLAILLLFTSYVPAHSAEIVNVEYVHSLIKKVWDIDVPYYEDSLKYAANMEYLLKAVDKANEILNGTPTTDYGNSEYATLYAADTVATIDAVNRLIEKQDKGPVFFITTTPDTSSFDIMISAAGEYTIDWGDGNIETITKTNTTMTPYNHTYDKAGEYTIGLGGKATDYNDAEIDITQEGSEELMIMSAAISFGGNTNIANISGSLGEIFSTLPDGRQPRFAATFMETSLVSIPEKLFSGIQGAPKDFMFAMTFVGTPITSIPENLFSGIQGAPANGMFYGTFGMTPITSIPDGLFDGISGAPAEMMFAATFIGCANLSGEIPLGLFGELSGAPAEMMFMMTFSECSGLTGPSARQPDGTYLYDYFDTATITQVGDMYTGATGLEDYPCIPELWGGMGGYCGAPAFYIQTTPDTSSFSFQISAVGPYSIEWGDGQIERVIKTDTTLETYSHTYDKSGEYTVALGGKAMAYASEALSPAISFAGNKNIAGISGSLGEIFSTLPDGSQPSFAMTFGETSLTSIPESLFSGIQGAPVEGMFAMTFGMTPITSIPENLFSGIQGKPASSMFVGTFSRCSGLTSIPEGLFASIQGEPAEWMFYMTFEGCSSLTSIPENLFASIQGAPANYTFWATFSGCSGLTSIPDGLFAGIKGAPAGMTFNRTFENCSGLTSIPEGLFAGIKGAPDSSMFTGTFMGCSGLTSIPEGLFAGIQGAPAQSMFNETFSGCSGLTSIPADLFSGIKGAPAQSMFNETFSGCSGLTSIPAGLFGELSGAPAYMMFSGTFSGCSGLTGPSARQPDGTYLYNYFNTATTSHVDNMYSGATGLEDYPCIPTAWGGAGGVCGGSTDPIEPVEASFYITTTPTTSSFSFQISAAGEYTIDWGDGKTETITKTNTKITTYSHTYASAGEYTIGLGGQATAYNSSSRTTAVSFSGNTNIAGISGSLGEIFSTLSDGSQPSFFNTFKECISLTGEIPSDLFAGITGAPVEWMFISTFSGCSGLTGEIPAGLFAGIHGAPADSMFSNTFNGCSGLTGSIPENLFAGITGAPAQNMFGSTFSGCSGLTGSIPENLFAGITGRPAGGMFHSTFSGCSGLTGEIPADLFAGISGAPASGMFQSTFYGCSNLSGEIPLGLFGTFTSNTPPFYMFQNTFNGCSKLTGPSARQPDGTYLYDYFDTASGNQVSGMYRGATGLSDYASIPAAWK